MSDGSVRTNQLPAASGMAATDRVVVNVLQSNVVTNTSLIAAQDLLGNSNVSYISIPVSSPPANSSAAGTAGMIKRDANNALYLCVSSNTWVKFVGSAF